MRSLFILLFLVGCANQGIERANRLEHELDRVEKYKSYAAWCRERGIMLTVNPYRRCKRAGCIPHRMDWDFYYKDDIRDITAQWRPKSGNSVSCVRKLF